jgi:hypothetical protein
LSRNAGCIGTIDWAESLLTLGYRELNTVAFDKTLGCILKSADDISQVRKEKADIIS